VSDFSSNIGDIGTLGNEIAQFELINSTTTLGRVLINSTVGLFGLFDVASNWGLEKTQEDFGQTLAVWGTPKGAYVVLPVLGSSTLRDVTGKAVDGAQRVKRSKPLKEVEKVGIITLQAVDTRVTNKPNNPTVELIKTLPSVVVLLINSNCAISLPNVPISPILEEKSLTRFCAGLGTFSL
jgi:phospholipid-binding lipoprotein MlaA